MAFVFLAIIAAAAIGEPDPAKTKTFSSTLHGFSLDYPAPWIKERPTFCGNELMGLTKNDRDRKFWPVVYLYSEPSTNLQPLRPCVHVMYQAVRSEAEGKIDERLSEDDRIAKITTSQGLVGYKFVEQAVLGAPSPVSSIRYWFPHHGRLLFLWCFDGARGLADLEPTFDVIANAVKMNDPFTETTKAFSKDCASVSYPADWSRTTWSFDDDREGFRFEAPHAGKKETATIQLLFDDRSLAQYEEENRTSLSRNSRWFEVKPFENSKGQKGLKVTAEIGFGITNKTTWFVLPCPDKRLAVLFCWDHDNDDVDWDPVFSQIAESFVVE